MQWRKRSTKKNKTWDGDGVLTVNTRLASLILKDADGKTLTKKQNFVLKPETFDGILSIGSLELQVDYKLDASEPLQSIANSDPLDIVATDDNNNIALHKSFKTIVLAAPQAPVINYEKELHTNDRAITLPSPPPASGVEPARLVKIDPHMSLKLRPHQVEGVKFMYECVMGYKVPGKFGCLVADEMGLGKTLMSIALIWTLIKQSPTLKIPVCSKILICCPVTLINNWTSEFRKWLGRNKLGILSLTGTDNQADRMSILNFSRYNVYQVLLINYEKVLLHHSELTKVKFDLLICDEGHRLKNSSNKVLNHLIGLNVARKVMLSGTPIQNDLVEFHTIIDFINPGILGDFKSFQKLFINPILRSRDVNCVDPIAKALGEKMSKQLIQLTQQFTIRRTQSILSQYLKKKTEVIVYVAPTKVQRELFQFILKLHYCDKIRQDSESLGKGALELINLLKKLCNAPALLLDDKLFKSMCDATQENPFARTSSTLGSSGKINVLIPIILELINLNEKIVLVSNYTKTLDMFELIMNKLNLSFARLDGSTPNAVRGKLVNEFNNSSRLQVFLLSSKSGGMGINLIGASRLVLFDSDWNPSVDLQSMARIHRDGQKKDCYIYRILLTGCIDEKIFQRQLMKRNLSSKFLDDDQKSKSDVFDYTDMRDLFTIHTNTNSNTHDLIECGCSGTGDNEMSIAETDSEPEDMTGDPELATKQNSWMSAREFQEKVAATQANVYVPIRDALRDYKHYDPQNNSPEKLSGAICDPIIANIVANDTYNKESNPLPITFVMTKESGGHDTIADEEIDAS